MDALMIVLGILGAVGAVPVLAAAFVRLARHRRANKRLRFTRRGQVDVILTTSLTTISRVGNASARRPLTPIGEVRAAAIVTRCVGEWYPKMPVHLHLSEAVTSTPADDVILLGGPILNAYSKRFLDEFNRAHPTLRIEFDVEHCTIRVGGFEIAEFDLGLDAAKVPTRELMLVVAWRNPFASVARRALLCAGLTTYGTAAAAEYVFGDVRLSALDQTKSAAHVVVVEADLDRGTLVTSKIICAVAI